MTEDTGNDNWVMDAARSVTRNKDVQLATISTILMALVNKCEGPKDEIAASIVALSEAMMSAPDLRISIQVFDRNSAPGVH